MYSYKIESFFFFCLRNIKNELILCKPSVSFCYSLTFVCHHTSIPAFHIHRHRICPYAVLCLAYSGDMLMSLFLNELYGFQLDSRRWYVPALLLILELEITCRTNICIARMFLYAFSHQEVGLHLFHSTQILILTCYFRYPLELRKDKPSKDKVLYEISSTQYLNPSITFWHFIVSEMLAMAILAFGTQSSKPLFHEKNHQSHFESFESELFLLSHKRTIVLAFYIIYSFNYI